MNLTDNQLKSLNEAIADVVLNESWMVWYNTGVTGESPNVKKAKEVDAALRKALPNADEILGTGGWEGSQYVTGSAARVKVSHKKHIAPVVVALKKLGLDVEYASNTRGRRIKP